MTPVTRNSARSAAQALRSSVAVARPDRLVGVEHEYEVFHDGSKIDFRQLVGTLDGLGPHLDPGDRNARRNAWGGITTADGAEAEIAIAPVCVAPGFSLDAIAAVADGEALLRLELSRERGKLPGSGYRLAGYSTHISVSVPDRAAPQIARDLARRFAPALGLLLDNEHSPGLLIRPRYARLEVCGDHLDGDRLRAALIATVAFVVAAETLPRRRLPPELRLHVERAKERHGWYVDRSASGRDLYAGGRLTPLLTRRGSSCTAQQVLEQCWGIARVLVSSLLAADELGHVDAVVLGTP